MPSGFSSRTHDPFLGTDYSLQAQLGAGGTAVVYLVERKRDRARLVAKVLRHAYAEDRERVQRMRREARAMQLLDHPNIVQIVDFTELRDGRPFIVTEWLDGRTLDEQLQSQVIEIPDALDFVCQALSALSAVHRLKIVHRDLTPRNLFLHQQAGVIVLKVLDFGFSKFLGHASSVLLTRDDMLVGTPDFTAPEAVRGDVVDEQADLYALGLVLFVLLTGEHPFADMPQTRQVFLAHVWRQIPPPSTLRSQVSPELDAVVARALAKRVEERYASAEEFLAALRPLRSARFKPSSPNARRAP